MIFQNLNGWTNNGKTHSEKECEKVISEQLICIESFPLNEIQYDIKTSNYIFHTELPLKNERSNFGFFTFVKADEDLKKLGEMMEKDDISISFGGFTVRSSHSLFERGHTLLNRCGDLCINAISESISFGNKQISF